jgi:hypothetical protein
MDGFDRVVRALRPTAINHFLAAALHFRVAALYRGIVQVFVGLTRAHRGGGAAAQTDQHRRATQNDDPVTGRQRQLVRLPIGNHAAAAGNHDRLVIAPQSAIT